MLTPVALKYFERNRYKGNGAWLVEKLCVSNEGFAWRLNKDGEWVQQRAMKLDDRGPIPICVHVLEQFGPTKPNDGKRYECCHRDDNRAHNHIDNLYWGTHAQNMHDASVNGKARAGILLVDESDIDEMIKLYQAGMHIHQVAEELGFGYTTVQGYLSKRIQLRSKGRVVTF